MHALILTAWLTLAIIAISFIGVAAAVIAMLRGYPAWQADLFRSVIAVIAYSCLAVYFFLAPDGWPVALPFAGAAGVEAYGIWDSWNKNKPRRRKESATQKVVRLIAGKLKVVAPS